MNPQRYIVRYSYSLSSIIADENYKLLLKVLDMAKSVVEL